MRITRLRLLDVRRHAQLDLAFAPGLTVVRGPNEAGKTTVQRAIELALSRKVTSTQGDLEEMRTWSAAADSRPVIQLDFVQEDIDATRYGHLEKAFRGSRGTVRLEVDGEVTTDPARAEEQLAQLTGIPTEPFFRSTASVRHHEMAELARDEAALRDRLQASISGADRGTSAAKKKLARALHDLQTRGDRNPGRLKSTEDEVARTAAMVEKGESELALLARDRDALAVTRERRSQAETTVAEVRALLEKAQQAERFGAERDAARERFDRYRLAVILQEEAVRLEATHPASQPLPVIRQLVERLRTLDRDIAALTAVLGEPVEIEVEAQAPEPTWRRWASFALLCAAGAVGTSLVGLATSTLATPFIAGAVLAWIVAGVGIGAVAARNRLAWGQFHHARQMRDEQVARRLRGRSRLEEDLRYKKNQFAEELSVLQLPDLVAAEDLLSREQAHIQAIEHAHARLDGLVGQQAPEGLPGLRDAAALEIEQKSSALNALGPIAREPRARERLEADARDAEAALEQCREDEAAGRARVEANTVDAEEVAREAERLASAREQMAGLQRRARVYQETLAAIERAERMTMRTATRYLEITMVADVERITNGRYRRVRVDDRTLDIRVFAPEKRDWVAVNQLSQGTVDQIYLAARLGLVRLVTGDRRPPLIFDDPFLTFDDERAVRALALLHDIASDFQVIYLTCSDRYDAVADLLVELPGPSMVDEGWPEAPETEVFLMPGIGSVPTDGALPEAADDSAPTAAPSPVVIAGSAVPPLVPAAADGPEAPSLELWPPDELIRENATAEAAATAATADATAATADAAAVAAPPPVAGRDATPGRDAAGGRDAVREPASPSIS